MKNQGARYLIGFFIILLLLIITPYAQGKQGIEDTKKELEQKNIKYDADTFIENARQGDIIIVKLFLLAGMDPNIKNKDDKTALGRSIAFGKIEVAKLLLENGAIINLQNKFGRTALHYSVDNLNSVKWLVENGAEIDIKTLNGATSLMIAAFEGYPDTVKYLIEKGANVNAQNNEGATALHLVSFGEQSAKVDIVNLLMNKGASIDIKDNFGQTPIDIAIKKGKNEIVKLLQTKGAKNSLASSSSQEKVEKPIAIKGSLTREQAKIILSKSFTGNQHFDIPKEILIGILGPSSTAGAGLNECKIAYNNLSKWANAGLMTVGKRNNGPDQIFNINLTLEGRKYLINENNVIYKVKAAQSAIKEITGIIQESPARAKVEFTQAYEYTPFFETEVPIKQRSAMFVLYDDGWRLQKQQ
jgi:ankyrin repeat protein